MFFKKKGKDEKANAASEAINANEAIIANEATSANEAIIANESSTATESTTAASTLPCHIKIYCVGGYSTSFWAKNVTTEFANQRINAEVSAYPIADIDATGAEADMILIGPQARYIEQKARNLFPKTTIAVVPFDVFGRANGAAGVEFIKTLSSSLGESHTQE